MKFVAFDIEIAKVVEGDNWDSQRPLGISVAATATDEGIHEWYGRGLPSGDPFPKMPQQQVCGLVLYLQAMIERGFTICTWNGAKFDFDILAEESCMKEECVELAMNHVDSMFQFFCENGWCFGLNAAAQGLGLSKTEGMNGALAPVMWANKQYGEVIEYVKQDAQVTLAVTKAAALGYLKWFTKAGKLKVWSVGKMLTVRECLSLPLPPSPSWISTPWNREDFVKWMKSTSVG